MLDYGKRKKTKATKKIKKNLSGINKWVDQQAGRISLFFSSLTSDSFQTIFYFVRSRDTLARTHATFLTGNLKIDAH